MGCNKRDIAVRAGAEFGVVVAGLSVRWGCTRRRLRGGGIGCAVAAGLGWEGTSGALEE